MNDIICPICKKSNFWPNNHGVYQTSGKYAKEKRCLNCIGDKLFYSLAEDNNVILYQIEFRGFLNHLFVSKPMAGLRGKNPIMTRWRIFSSVVGAVSSLYNFDTNAYSFRMNSFIPFENGCCTNYYINKLVGK